MLKNDELLSNLQPYLTDETSIAIFMTDVRMSCISYFHQMQRRSSCRVHGDKQFLIRRIFQSDSFFSRSVTLWTKLSCRCFPLTDYNLDLFKSRLNRYPFYTSSYIAFLFPPLTPTLTTITIRNYLASVAQGPCIVLTNSKIKKIESNSEIEI